MITLCRVFVETLGQLIRTKTDANWWIDNRMDSGVTLVKRLIAGR